MSVENFRPGAMEKMGIGYEKLAEANPTIIHASISGTVPCPPSDKLPLATYLTHTCQDTDLRAPLRNEQATI